MKQISDIHFVAFSSVLIIFQILRIISSQTIPPPSNLNKIEYLLPQIVQTYFSACNLVIVHDDFGLDQRIQAYNGFDLAIFSSSNTTNSSFSSGNGTFTSTIHSIVTTLFEEHSRDLYFANFMNFNKTTQSPYPSRLGSISRLRPNCFLTMIFMDSIYDNSFDQLFNLLIPPTLELTKKDEDHYIIVTREELAEEILTSHGFSMKIQYKLLIHKNESQSSLLSSSGLAFKTVCFYCNPGISGKEKVIPLPIELTEDSSLPSKLELFPEVVRNLNGYQMRVVCPTGTHQQARMKQVNGEYLPMRGSYFMTLGALVPVFNFTYKVGPSTLGGTGLQQPNGTWIGTVGDILYERADMGLVTAITYQRYKYIGYNYPVTWEWLTFGTAIPVANFTWEALFWPLSKAVWIALLISLIIVIVIYSCLSKFELSRKPSETDEGTAEVKSSFAVSDSTTYVWGTLLEQSLNFPPQAPLKILIIFWLFLVLIITVGYKSKLVTCLAFPVVEKTPDSFDELAKSGYKVGLCYVGGAAYNVFKTSTNPTYLQLYSVMELFKDMTDCFVRTLQQKVSCIGYESMASYVLNKNLTDRFGRAKIRVTTASTFFVGCGYVITKRAIFRPNFDKYIMTWMDFGLLGEWRKTDHENVRRLRASWEIETGQDRDSGSTDDGGPQKLTVGNLKVVFVLLVLGTVAGILALTVEKLHSMGIERIRFECKSKMQLVDLVLNKIR